MRIATAKETYLADEALFDTATQRTWLALLAAALVLFPFMADAYWLYLACLVAINIASATGLNILTGYTGLVSLGQAAFMGLGAYTVAVMELRLGTPVLVNLLGGGVVAMLGGLFVGIPSLRVKGLYLAISTIAASFIAHFIFANWEFTGGTTGLQVPPARLLGVDLDTSFKIYWLIVPVTALMVLGAANLFRTRIGRAFIAIRDREDRVRFSGYDTAHVKACIFCVAAVLSSIGGAFFTLQVGLISPGAIGVVASIEMVIYAAVGGRLSIPGAVIGALLIGFLKSYLSETFPEIWLYFLGAVFIVVVVAMPNGLAGIFGQIQARRAAGSTR